MPFTGEVDISGILARLGDPTHGLASTRLKVQDETDDIFRATDGATDMSTSVALAVVPKIVWDVNGYYRQLNIDWPYKPTKRQLQQGFLRVDGHTSERSTYYMKQLLNPDTRAEYDAMPLGSHFHDKYTTEEQMRKLSEVAKEKTQEEGSLVTVDDLMKDFDPLPDLVEEEEPIYYPWAWGFYSHRSRKHHTSALEKWQALLLSEFARQGLETVIALGYIGRCKEEFKVCHFEGRDIFFLHEESTPTPELAETAVSKYMAQRSERKK